ncbi:MAG TPA: hypothetical protein VEB00_10345 [Clostridia bacterium]|nr:hypothetical protein [Clostridia bacterium]
MKKIMLLIAALLLISAGLALSLLYGLGERAIVESIIKDSAEIERAFQSADTEKAAPAAAGSEKAEEVNNKPAGGAEPSKPADHSISQIQKNEENQQIMESAKETKNKVSISEKASLTKLLLSKLTKSDISELKGMLSNGITSEEKRRAKEILYSRLSEDDINKIKDAYVRYTKQEQQ